MFPMLVRKSLLHGLEKASLHCARAGTVFIV